MCGITGFFDRGGIDLERVRFHDINDSVSYRGPDGFGYACFRLDPPEARLVSFAHEGPIQTEENVTLALGHRRLAVIDLSPNAAQPMASQTGGSWITYNGEIYNYIELRNELASEYDFRTTSDTEVILAAYERWGEECVHHFNGIWSFALADLKNAKLFCSRDRFGVKPFHYFYNGSQFVFGSEIKQLLHFAFVPRRINDDVVYDYLAFGAVDHAEETFFASIRRLMQGSNLVLDLRDGSIRGSRYYHPGFEKNVQITLPEASEEFRRLLSDSVRLQLRADVEVGSCLSGGLDSSSIVCLIRDHMKTGSPERAQHTFSSHFEDEEANELEYMQEVIRETGARSHFTYPSGEDLVKDLDRIVFHQEEPFGSTSIFAQWSVFKLVKENDIKVMLDGQGADEMLAGYVGLYSAYFHQLRAKRQYCGLLKETRRYASVHRKPWAKVLMEQCRGALSVARGRANGNGTVPDWLDVEFARACAQGSMYGETMRLKPFGVKEHLENKLYQMTFINNLQALLRYEDRNSMAFSVESRVPFLDHRLVEFILGLPSRFKLRDGYTKRVLRDAMAGVLPEKVRWRVGKLGFATPERKWQNEMLGPVIEKAIQDERVRRYIQPEKAAEYFARSRTSAAADFASWRWLNLSLWMKAYDLG